MNRLNYKSSIRFNNPKESILDASRRFFPVLQALAAFSDDYTNPVLVHQKKEVALKPLELDQETGGLVIANAILNFRAREYKLDSKLPEITLDYSQDLGFSFLVSYKTNEGKYNYDVYIGSKTGGSFSTFNAFGVSRGFDHVFGFVKTIISCAPVKFASVGLYGDEYIDACLKNINGLGWITYFPKEYPVAIPDDLPGIEYEHTATGKYLILTREDFTTDPIKLEAGKQKLIATMEEIARRVPGYRRD